jgi:general secretion pathway protein J
MMSSEPVMAIRRMNQPRGTGGFTLIELLVAIMILTLLMTASFGAVRVASRSWEAGHLRANATEEMRATSDFLRRQFGQLTPLAWTDGNDERIAFSGDHDQVRFIAPAPQHLRGAGFLVYELAVVKDDDGQMLILSFGPLDPGDVDFGDPNFAGHLTLVADFEDVSFNYFGAEMDDEPQSWKQSWRLDAEHYPSAIRIHTSMNDSQVAWPDLVFPLRHGEES